VGKVLCISAVVLVLLVGIYIVASNVGNAPPMLLNPSEPLLDEGVAMVMVCGEQPNRETANRTAEQAPTSASGSAAVTSALRT
jgi:hypothetical protein